MSIQVEDGSRNAKYVEDWLAGVTRGEQHSHTNPRTPLERSSNLQRRSRPLTPATRAFMIDHEADNGAIDPAEKYAKRPRHKTKADKYEYKGDTERPVKEPGGSRRKRLKRGNTLNEDFQATNIDVARVSLKPKNNVGIFSRSKKSAPLAGRDLPDLTFTKMDFLHKPAGTAKRDMAQRRMQKSNKGHKTDVADEQAPSQSPPVQSGVGSQDAFPTLPFAEHDDTEDAQLPGNLPHPQNVPGRRTEELKSGVSWSTSPPQASRHNPKLLLEHRTSLSREACAPYASGEDTNNKTRRSRRVSLTVEPESSVSNQWFNLFTERLLRRKQGSPSSGQGLQPRTDGDALEDMLAPCLRRLEPDSPERVSSNAQTSTHRYETSKRSDVRKKFPFPDPPRDISRKYAHGPQSYLDDNLRAETRGFYEQDRSHTRGKHEYEAQKGYSVTDDPDAIATLDKHNQEWYWKGYTAYPPPNAHHFNKLHEGLQTLFRASYGSGALASRHSYAQEEQLYPTSGQVVPDSRSNDYIMDSSGVDHAVPGNQCWNWNRDRPGDSDSANGGLDAFDLKLLESIQPEEQCQESDLPPPRHSRVLEIGTQNLLGEDGQARSSRPRLPTDSIPLLHMQALTSGPEQFIDHQLRLNRSTLQRSLKEEAFNPYKRPNLFA